MIYFSTPFLSPTQTHTCFRFWSSSPTAGSLTYSGYGGLEVPYPDPKDCTFRKTALYLKFTLWWLKITDCRKRKKTLWVLHTLFCLSTLWGTRGTFLGLKDSSRWYLRMGLSASAWCVASLIKKIKFRTTALCNRELYDHPAAVAV